MRRRDLLAVGLGCAAMPTLARAGSLPGQLSFQIWRNAAHIGAHTIRFTHTAGNTLADITAELVIKLGPVPIFHYRHHAMETWADDRFQALDARTVSNGKVETVSAHRDGATLAIARSDGPSLSPANAAPLTHWNRAAFEVPMFNPQTGAMVREAVARHADDSVQAADGRTIPATRYTLTGDADITDWYDAGGQWCGLRGKVKDGSYVEYRRT